jgi:hypothetical protein
MVAQEAVTHIIALISQFRWMRNKSLSLWVSCVSAWISMLLAVAIGESAMSKKVTFMVMALLAGALMVPDHEAFARGGFHGGGGGFGGFHGGGFGGFHGGHFGGFHGGFAGFRSGRFNHFAGAFHGGRFGHRGRFGRGFGIYGSYGDYLYGYPCDPYDYYRCNY